MKKRPAAACLTAAFLGQSVVARIPESHEPPHTHDRVDISSDLFLFARVSQYANSGERRAVPFIPNGWEEAANEAIRAQYSYLRSRSAAALFT